MGLSAYGRVRCPCRPARTTLPGGRAMSLSDRLRAAEEQRRSATSDSDDTTLDLTSTDAAVIDLTARRQKSAGHRPGRGGSGDTLEPYRFEPATDEPVWAAGAEGISYNPVRDGDASSLFGE